jgi:hypothetical protein
MPAPHAPTAGRGQGGFGARASRRPAAVPAAPASAAARIAVAFVGLLASGLLAGCVATPESAARDARMAAARQRAAATLPADSAGRRGTAVRAATADRAGPSAAVAADDGAADAGALPPDYRDQLRETYRTYLDLPADRYGLRFGRAYRAVRDGSAHAPARTGWVVQVTVEEDTGGTGRPTGRRKDFAHLSFFDPATRAFEPPVPVWKLPQLQYLYREVR